MVLVPNSISCTLKTKLLFVIFVLAGLKNVNGQPSKFYPEGFVEAPVRPGGEILPPEDGFEYLPDSAKTCLMNKCNAKTIGCALYPAKNMAAACSTCLRYRCAYLQGLSSFIMEQCFRSAAWECNDCPKLTQLHLVFHHQCVSCRDGCVTDEMKKSVSNKVFSRSKCWQQCVLSIGCPAPGHSCQKCIKNECSKSTSENAQFPLSCAQTVISTRKCSTCIQYFDEAKCTECHEKCDSDTDSSLPDANQDGSAYNDEDYPKGPAGPEKYFMTKSAVTCLQKDCFSKCVYNRAMTFGDKFEGLGSTCKNCIMKACPANMDATIEFDFLECRKKAYEDCAAAYSCPARTAEEKKMYQECNACQTRCLPEATREEIRRNVKILLQCEAKCRNDLDCPKPPSRACEKCMRRECDSEKDPRARFACEQQALATGKCSICTAQLSTGPGRPFDGRKCLECMAKCRPGGESYRPGPKRDPRTYPDFPVMPGAIVTCLTEICEPKCEASKIKVDDEGMGQLTTACRDCITAQCPKMEDALTFDTRKCRFDAYLYCATAYSCPALTEEQLVPSKECKSCYMKCFPEAERGIIRRAHRAFLACQGNCKTRHSCPDAPDQGCMECMEKECPLAPGEEMKSNCQQKAMYSGKCPSCVKNLPAPGSFDPHQCAGCMSSCHPPDDSGPVIYFMGWRPQEQRYLPAATGECIRKQCVAKCPLEGERIVHGQSLEGSCVKCIDTICGFADDRPMFDIEGCRHKAHTACGAGYGCRTYDKEYKKRLGTCGTCIDACVPKSVKEEVRNKMRKAAQCRAKCDVTHDDCPQDKRAPCEKCLRTHCEYSQEQDCVMKVRADAQKCPDCSWDGSTSKCIVCMRNCDQGQ